MEKMQFEIALTTFCNYNQISMEAAYLHIFMINFRMEKFEAMLSNYYWIF